MDLKHAIFFVTSRRPSNARLTICRILARRLVLPIEVAAGHHLGVTPTVLRSTEYERVYTTAYEADDADDSEMT